MGVLGSLRYYLVLGYFNSNVVTLLDLKTTKKTKSFVRIRNQGWRSGETAPWPGFNAGPVLLWLSLLVIALLRGFFSGLPGFPPSTKTNTQANADVASWFIYTWLNTQRTIASSCLFFCRAYCVYKIIGLSFKLIQIFYSLHVTFILSLFKI